MTPAQVLLVKLSFATLRPTAQEVGQMFYERLFAIDPDLKPLFKGNAVEQSHKLMQMIGVAVNGLHKLDSIVPAVQALGRRHVGYGVKPRDYETVGAALLWTLEKGLEDNFTAEVREAWVAAYTLLADTMKAAADQPALRQSA